MKKFQIHILAFLVFLLFNNSIFYSQWNLISNVNTSQLACVKFLDASTGLVSGVGGIWRSINSGYNWTQVYTGGNIKSISFADASIGIAVGDSGCILRTANRGLSWLQITSPYPRNLNGVSFQQSGIGCIAGDSSRILKTTDAGITWTGIYIQQNYYYDLYCIKMSGSGFGFAGGGSNREVIMSSGNWGTNWSYAINNMGSNIRAVEQSISYVDLFVGDNGRIRKIYGNNWIFPSSPTLENLNSVSFSSITGYACGNNGVIIKTIDTGDNWALQISNTTQNLYGISFINDNTGWCIGQNGIVLFTVNGGITSIKIEKKDIPTSFHLYQNYPNPFNPTTKIKFSIPANSVGQTFLSVYDILGREVATLLNEKLHPGTYEVEWDGSNYASGVYFYKLISGSYSESKKLILLK